MSKYNVSVTMSGVTVVEGGGVSGSYVAKTANYILTAADYTADCTANSFTITLPTAAGIVDKIYNIKNTGIGTIIVDADGTETIDNALTHSLSQWDNIQVQSTGSGWIIL